MGLHCCTRAFFSCGEWGLLFIAVHGLLIAMASLVFVFFFKENFFLIYFIFGCVESSLLHACFL